VWILVVEDEPAMAALLKQSLEEANHSVAVARNGQEALHAAQSSNFDAVILDIMLPRLDGFEVARRLRFAGISVPILMLTARDADQDIIRGLDAGADDYLTKPFSLKVLLARLRAVARRGAAPPRQRYQVDDLVLIPEAREVERGGERIHLTATEYRLLEFLLRRAGRAVSRSSIIEAVWGFDDEIEENTVDVFIRLLREKVDQGRARKLIHTVRGFGYILREGE
jgi:DNA-binding response OmpR family regulator